MGQEKGEERGLCPLNSEIPSSEQPSLTSVAKNFDSSFHLVSIRRGNSSKGWPRHCSTCTAWPRAPVKEPKRMKTFPSVRLGSLGQEELLLREMERCSTLLGRFIKNYLIAFTNAQTLNDVVWSITLEMLGKCYNATAATNSIHSVHRQQDLRERASTWIRLDLTILLFTNCRTWNRLFKLFGKICIAFPISEFFIDAVYNTSYIQQMLNKWQLIKVEVIFSSKSCSYKNMLTMCLTPRHCTYISSINPFNNVSCF